MHVLLRYIRVLLLAVICAILPARSLQARLGNSLEAQQEIYAEKGLKETIHFIKSLDPLVTNFGSDKDKRYFRRAIVRYMYAQTVFLSFHYGQAVKEVVRCQRLLLVIFKSRLKDTIKRANTNLFYIAGLIYKEKTHKFRSLVALGFRDLENARQKLTLAENINTNLVSNKLHYVLQGMKYANHGNMYYLNLKLQLESIYPPHLKNYSFVEYEQSILSGFPRQYKKLLPLLYEINFKNYYLPSVKEKQWDDTKDFSSLKDDLTEFHDIEDPPVKEIPNKKESVQNAPN